MKRQNDWNSIASGSEVVPTNASTTEEGSNGTRPIGLYFEGDGQDNSRTGPGSITQETEIESQAAYHRQLFVGWYEWESFWEAAVELIGNGDDAIRLGLDQLGHFGPRGVTLVADRLLAAAEGELKRVVELGSGFGGALRHMGRHLKSRGLHPWLIGVELVCEHCELAAAIGRTMGDTDPLILHADARSLPLPSADADAVFVTGSASHISSMGEVLAECYRVLRLGGVLAMTEEVSLRPQGAPEPGAAFLSHHRAEVFRATSPEQRREELDAAGLKIESFESLVDWAVPLLRQRVSALRFMGKCAMQMFGTDSYEQLIGTLASTADEYERGTIQPTLIIARRAKQ